MKTNEILDGKVFEYNYRISGNHLDVFGHLNNARYLEIFEEARWNVLERGALGLTQIMKEKLGPVILEINIKYKKELRNKNEILITTQLTEMKNSKVFIMKQQMINKQTGDVSADMDLHIGFLDLSSRKLVIPKDQWLIDLGVAINNN